MIILALLFLRNTPTPRKPHFRNTLEVRADSLGLILQQRLEALIDNALQSHAPTSRTCRLTGLHITANLVLFAFRACAYPPGDLRHMRLSLILRRKAPLRRGRRSIAIGLEMDAISLHAAKLHLIPQSRLRGKQKGGVGGAPILDR